MVGAISVHGTNGIWGVICSAPPTARAPWRRVNGVSGSVTGLFYGDTGQLVAQLIGVATHRLRVHDELRVNMILEAVWGHRVPAKVELEGLDIPEMGALGYPEFVLKPESATTT